MIPTRRVSFQEQVKVQYFEPLNKDLMSKLYYQEKDYLLFEQRERARWQRAYARAVERQAAQLAAQEAAQAAAQESAPEKEREAPLLEKQPQQPVEEKEPIDVYQQKTAEVQSATQFAATCSHESSLANVQATFKSATAA